MSASKRRNPRLALLATLVVVIAAPLARVEAVPPQPVPPQAANTFSFGAAGDFRANETTVGVLQTLAEAKTDFFLALGDLSYDHVLPESAWCNFVTAQIGATFPFELVSGNHEDDGPDGSITNFAACLPHRLGALTGTYGKEFYFDYPASSPLARVILISPGLNFPVEGIYTYDAGSPRGDWLTAAIDDARAKAIPWVIVGMHKFCLGVGHPCDMGPGLENLLVSKRVDLVLQAHDHAYLRGKQLALGPSCPAILDGSFIPACVVNDGSSGVYTKGAGPVTVISGTGGSVLSPMYPDVESPYFANVMSATTANAPSAGFVKYTVSATQLTARYVAVTPGAFSDSFTIKGAPTPPVPPARP